MKTYFTFLLFTVSTFISLGQSKYSAKLEWAFSSGSVGLDRAMGLAVDNNGDFVCSGFFTNTVNFNPMGVSFPMTSAGGEDAYVARYDKNRNLIWAVSFSSQNGYVLARDIDIDQNSNVYVTGRFTGSVDFDPSSSNFILNSNGAEDTYLAKLDPLGNLIWVVAFGGSSRDEGISVTYNPVGAILITGHFRGSVDFDPSPNNLIKNGANAENVFLSCFDQNGNLMWNNAMISSSNSASIARGYHATVDDDYNFIVSGAFFGTIDLDGSSATVNATAQSASDAFIAAYNPLGIYQWSFTFGGTSNVIPSSVELGTDSSIYVGGYFEGNANFNPSGTALNKSSAGSRDIFISKFDASRNLQWNVAAGGVSSEVSTKLIVDNRNHVFITGYRYSSFDANPDPSITEMVGPSSINGDGYLWALDSLGNYITAYSIGAGSEDIGQVIDIDLFNNVYVGGSFTGIVDFNPSSQVYNMTSNGDKDFFIQKVSLCKETTDSIDAYGCQYYISPSGKLFNSNGIYSDTLTNQNGCDSVLTINLSLNQLSNSISQNGNVLSANTNQSVSYQWLDCNNGYLAISGETQSTYTATANGSYAVEITQGNCKDTSNCMQVIRVSLDKNEHESKISIYPNPSSGLFTIEGVAPNMVSRCQLYNISGKQLKVFKLGQNNQFEIEQASGIYFLQIQLQDGGFIHKKIIKK